MPYKSDHYLTNSKLTKFKNQISGEQQRDLTEAFRMGTLHDAYITSPHTINHFDRSITTKYGQKYYYSAAEMKQANDMRTAFLADPVCNQWWSTSILQEEVYNEGVDFDGLTIACACTCDGRLKHGRKPWDLKRTIATSQGAFEDAFIEYEYTRQGYFYLQVSEADIMPFFGQSDKKPYPVYKVYIRKDNELYDMGKQLTHDLVLKYDVLSPLL